MNKENAHLYLPLVQAMADGKTIQIANLYNEWRDLGEIEFNGSPDRYRIKQEPREFKLALEPSGSVFDASPNSMGIPVVAPIGGSIIRVREILD